MPYSSISAVHSESRPATFWHDLTAGGVVFLIALPLCLGVALASNAPLVAGLIAGIIGGVLVGALSGSHTSVSGPAAGLTAVVATQIGALGSFEAFLLSVVIAGGLQIALGALRAGFLVSYVPSSVINGLLAAIGVILILKQIPHLLGHDSDPEGEMSFVQPDHETTFSEFVRMLGDLHLGAAVVGIGSVALLLGWEKLPARWRQGVPAPLVVVLFGIGLQAVFARLQGAWEIQASHLVQVPIAQDWRSLAGFLVTPDFSQWRNPAVYSVGLMIAAVASLETLLNLEAIDKLDPQQRSSPPSRELVAQGIGNVVSGLLGGIPVTSVIVRSSINILSGARSKAATITHGMLLLICATLLPTVLNRIPLACLAAILLVTGVKLASPQLFRRMWSEGKYQWLPFLATLIAIVVTDLLVGVVIGLGVSIAFLLAGNLRRPLRRIVERRAGGEVLRIELANQVSFLNRPSLERALEEVPRGGHLLIDATHANYIDPDVLSLIREFKRRGGPARGVQVSLRGFRDKYQLADEILYVDYSTRDLQERLTSRQVLEILREGNERFRTGNCLQRDLGRQVQATAAGQHPLAVVLSCIDSRTPTEIIFDVGLGDVLCARIAGNVTSPRVLGSIEYGCAVAGAKLVVVLGHTSCGAIGAAVAVATRGPGALSIQSYNLEPILEDIQASLDPDLIARLRQATPQATAALADELGRRNVRRSVREILERSPTIHELVKQGRVDVVGGMYDVATGRIEFLEESAASSAT